MILDDTVAQKQQIGAAPRPQARDEAAARLAREVGRFAAIDEPTSQETEAFWEVARPLVDVCRAPDLVTISRVLAHAARAPEPLLEALVALGGRSAAYILRHSRRFAGWRLAELAAHTDVELACAIAGRADLDGATALALVYRSEPAIALALASNLGARFDSAVCRGLARHARAHGAIATALRRRPVDPKTGAALFLYAAPEVRAEILRRARVEDLLGPRRDLAGVADDDVAERVEALALAGEGDAMVAELVTAVGCTPGDVASFLSDTTGEAAALLFAAAGVTAPAAGRIFMSGVAPALLSAPALHDLVSIVANVSQRAARRLVSAMCGGLADPTGRRRHLPVYEPGTPARVAASERRRVPVHAASRTRIAR